MACLPLRRIIIIWIAFGDRLFLFGVLSTAAQSLSALKNGTFEQNRA
jgi:hypothetical protein